MRHLIAVLVSTTALFMSPLALAGDAENGKKLVTEKGCIGCHGADGNSPMGTWPKIAGQGEKYIIKQLRAFRVNDAKKTGRADPQMAGFAPSLTDQQIDDLAAYFSKQTVKIGQTDPAQMELGYRIYRGGDIERGIPSCMGCHGPSGAGNPASVYPSLSGQWAAYVKKQLNDFKAETRSNDQNRMMRDIASKMSPEEIEAVSAVIQSLH